MAYSIWLPPPPEGVTQFCIHLAFFLWHLIGKLTRLNLNHPIDNEARQIEYDQHLGHSCDPLLRCAVEVYPPAPVADKRPRYGMLDPRLRIVAAICQSARPRSVEPGDSI